MTLWLLTPALTGGVIMALEIAAFRLYAPYLGYSIYVWGSMISVVMAAISGGYALGGWLADRSRHDGPLYLTVLASGIYQAIIAFTVRWMMNPLGHLGEFTGTVLATFVIFAPPMTGLAMTSPFVIRLLARSGSVGVTAGKVYAVSTVGSIAGILATAFYLIPRLGTHATLLILCATSIVIGAAGLALSRRPAAAAAVLLVALPWSPNLKSPPGEIWHAESAYNVVRVIRYRGYLWLALNDPRFSHTTRKENAAWSGSYQDEFALGPLLVGARRLLVLGMGAGGSISATRVTAPEIQVDAVEIDPRVVEGAARFFGLRADERWLRIHVGDARPWLAKDSGTYELVHVDLYHGGPYVPFYLVTEEFFRLVRARMAADGLLMMNVFDRSRDHQLLGTTCATLRRVFPSVEVLSREDANHILFAFPRNRQAESIRAQLRSARGDEQIMRLAGEAASAITELIPPAVTPVFTDDHAPVEEMTRRMLAKQRR